MKKIYLSTDGKTLKRVTKNCKGEVAVPDGVEVIGKRAFAGLEEVTSVILPSSVKDLGEEAFEGCSALTCIVLPEGVEVIPKRAFADCHELAAVSLPSTLKTIEKEAFAHCTNLNRIEIPDSVGTIGAKAFSYCKSLAEVVMPASLIELGEKSFYTCSSLKVVDIPEGVEAIPEACFEDCKDLTAAIFHDGLKTIAKYAFRFCSIKFIEISSTVETIDEEAFRGNKAIGIQLGASVCSLAQDVFWDNAPISITVDKRNMTYTDEGCNVIMEVDSCKVIRGTASSSIPETATVIGYGAFQDIPQVLVVPSSVAVIETAAFFNCQEGSIVILQEGVSIIKWGAFQQKNGQNITVYIPSTTRRIDGQYSSVEFRLDAANPYYNYDADGHNIISKDGVLVWGHLIKGIPTEGVNRVEVVNYGKVPYSELTVPDNVKYISYDICRLLTRFDGLKTLKLSKGTIMSMPGDWKTNCEITVTIPRKKSASGISKNTEYIIPRGSSWFEIYDFLGNDSIV